MRQRRTIEFRKFHDTKPLEDSHRQLQDKAYFFGSLESSGEDEGGLHDVSSEPNSPRPLQPVDALQTLRSPNTALQDRQTMHPVHPSSSNSSSIGGSVREAAAALISTQAKLQLSNSPNSMKGLPTSDIKGEALRGNPPHGGLPLGDSQQRPRPIGQSSSLKSSASGTTGNIGEHVLLLFLLGSPQLLPPIMILPLSCALHVLQVNPQQAPSLSSSR